MGGALDALDAEGFDELVQFLGFVAGDPSTEGDVLASPAARGFFDIAVVERLQSNAAFDELLLKHLPQRSQPVFVG